MAPRCRSGSTMTGVSDWSSLTATCRCPRIRRGRRATRRWNQSLCCCASSTTPHHHFDASGLGWSGELADPLGGPIICHNDVCLENVVFRDGVAVALPGLRLRRFLGRRMPRPGPIRSDVCARRRRRQRRQVGMGRGRPAPARLRLVADAYGADSTDRAELVGDPDRFDPAHGDEFVRRRAGAGDPGFVKMWHEIGGIERFERRRRWFTHNMARLEQVLQ